MAIDFNTGVDISEGTSFADFFEDTSEDTSYYRLWTGEIDDDGNVVDGSVVDTDQGGGWVAAEDLASLEVSTEQFGHNTLYVQPYSD
ncbi:MAG: serine protease, partial [Desulfohalobiaceae bacterium]